MMQLHLVLLPLLQVRALPIHQILIFRSKAQLQRQL